MRAAEWKTTLTSADSRATSWSDRPSPSCDTSPATPTNLSSDDGAFSRRSSNTWPRKKKTNKPKKQQHFHWRFIPFRSASKREKKQKKNKWKRKLVTRSKTRRRPRVRSLLTREPFRSKIETFVCFFLFIRPRPRHRQTQSKSTSAIHRPHRDTPRNHCPKSRRSQPSCLDRIVVVVVVV